jgi:hypothetical protein
MNRRHVALYRILTTAYPRKFRDEYGEDLMITFARQLDEHGPARCWVRTVHDLTLTIPAQHLEVRMKHPTSKHVTSISFAIAISGTLVAVVIGTSLYAVIVLSVTAVAGTFAVLSRKAAKPALALKKPRSWKKFLTAGSVLLTAIIVAINLPGTQNQELSEFAWSLMMLTFLFSFALIGSGIVLAATQLHGKRHHS